MVSRSLLLALVLIFACAVPAQAASVTSKAKRAVQEEVAATFETATYVTVTCQRITAKRFKCTWSDRNGPSGSTDYFGRAKVTVGRYGGDAKLFQVRCHYCRSGTPRSKGVY